MAHVYLAEMASKLVRTVRLKSMFKLETHNRQMDNLKETGMTEEKVVWVWRTAQPDRAQREINGGKRPGQK